MLKFWRGFKYIWDFHWAKDVDWIEAGEMVGIALIALILLSLLTMLVVLLK